MNRTLSFLLIVFFTFIFSSLSGQVTISGEVNDSHGEPMVGATVVLEPVQRFAVTDAKGAFNIPNVDAGEYTLVITYVGAKTYRESLTINSQDITLSPTLEDDPLNLQNVVVTGVFDPRIQLESSTAITTLEKEALQRLVPRGTADILQAIPGVFTDPSAGEVFTRVYARGISASAEDDIGWYYVSLQEDGLPVSLIQHSYYTPELFHRMDLTTEKVEAIRGGSASITALNAPGGIFNFISQGPKDQFGGEISLQGGLQGENNPLTRIDGTLGGPLGNNWFFNLGGHYRNDEGARNTDFTFSKGGQLKMNIIKRTSGGYLKFYGKILDDFTNRYTGVAATDWDDPKAAFGQDFNTTALMMPGFESNIPDPGRLDEGATNGFDPSQGVHAQDRAFGVDLFQELGKDWILRFNTKYSRKRANWQTSISNNFVSLADPTSYFLGGGFDGFGQVVFRDARTGTELARVDNTGTLAAFQGGSPSFEYLTDGRLPNDAVMGTAAWYKDNAADELIGEVSLSKNMENHDLTLGAAYGFSDTSMFTQGSFGFVTYEPDPRMLSVTLENPGQPVIEFTDANGLSSYGGLFFINARADVSQIAAFVNDRWKIQENLYLDAGLRYESIGHDGSKDRWINLPDEGGVDGDVTTAFDNFLRVASGERDSFDFTYDYLSYSAGLNYTFKQNVAVFFRFSRGNKAPELNYYFNNFENVPINQAAEIQKINQAELGVKWGGNQFSFTTTAFWSQLRDIATTNFEFDEESGSIFYTPVQFNDSRTIGLEWESAYAVTPDLGLTFNGTLQNAVATQWTIYDAAGTVDISDDSITDFSDNELPFNPNIMFNLGTEYEKERFNGFLRWQFMGEREGNVANAFQLPSYSIFNAGLGYAINENIDASILGTNLLNSAGLANFFGANSFGANANGVTTEFVQSNPNASFVVVPVLPRAVVLKLNYRF
ncbi:TonB-dependent receptor [Flavobacteriaceae bacterium TP-CH-4]|uniref:TonB-dependent receptor n=1 Tax=Pelagihabitans pacificus TaxID=2696054 RepID=A0A967AT17_9FLAO|nr:TonB-dependent receptor [Pelagihabitans pacificus]NHF59514.1 TonB-dependent receptor [Pelagihabitans pacificus]